jgi:hypothetical protein
MYKTTTVNHSLVYEDYYAKDLAYQSQYDKIENVKINNKDITVNWNEENSSLIVEFSDKMTKQGTISVYNPADVKKDQVFPFNIKDGSMLTFDNIQLDEGRWKIKVDWTEGDTPYYLQKELYISRL